MTGCITPAPAAGRDHQGAQVRYDALISLAATWNRVATIEEAALALVAGVKFVLSIDVWQLVVLDEGAMATVVEGTLERAAMTTTASHCLSPLEQGLLATGIPVLLDARELAARHDDVPRALRGRTLNALFGLAASGSTGAREHALVIGTRATLSPLDLKFAGLLAGMFADKVRQLRAEERLRAAYTDLADRDARLHADLCESRDFQRSLLQAPIPPPGIEIATLFEPIEMVGGDIYDLTVLSDGRLRVFVVDATGHGLQAALRTMVLLSEYNNLKHRTASPVELLRALNSRVFAHRAPLELLSPAVCADIDTDRAVIANAGAPPVLLASARGNRVLDAGARMLLGMNPSIVLEQLSTPLAPGDRLLFATDGLYDQRGPTNAALGYDRCLATLASAHCATSSVTALRDQLETHRGSAKRDDDVTLVAVETGK